MVFSLDAVCPKNAALANAAKEPVIVLSHANANASAAIINHAHSKANVAKIASAAKIAAKQNAPAKFVLFFQLS